MLCVDPSSLGEGLLGELRPFRAILIAAPKGQGKPNDLQGVVLPFWRHLMRHLRSTRHRKLIEEVVRARTAAGLSQRALAAKLKRSPSYVSIKNDFAAKVRMTVRTDLSSS